MCLGIPGKIIAITSEDPLFRSGRVSFEGVEREVSLAFTEEAQAGDYVVVHAGFSISIVNESEAQKIFDLLEEEEKEFLKK